MTRKGPGGKGTSSIDRARKKVHSPIGSASLSSSNNANIYYSSNIKIF